MSVHCWRVAEGTNVSALVSAIASLLEAEVEPGFNVERVVLDTFDGRLGARSQALVIDRTQDAWVARLLDAEETTLASTQVDAVPVRPETLPSGRLRDRLVHLVAPRALLERVAGRIEVCPLVVRDASERTVLCAHVERVLVDRPGNEEREVGLYVRLLPVKGNEEAFARAQRALQGVELSPVEEGVVALMHAAASVPRGDLAPPLHAEVVPSERTDRAAKAALRALYGAWRAQEPGLRGDVDVEFLHAWRVALRRTRAVLGQLDGALPQVSTQRFRSGFRWLQAVSGPVRDLDVWLERLPEISAGLPVRVAEHLGPLRAHLRAARMAAHVHLLEALASPRHARLMRDWADFVHSGVPRRPAAPLALLPVREVLRARLKKVHKQLLRDGRAIELDTPAVHLHELRKTAKKLRYLLDVFPDLWPSGPLATVLAELKALQSNLGAIQDLEVQASGLAQHAAAMMRQGVDADTVLAIGVLVEDLRARQAEARGAFEGVFEGFDRKEVRRALKGLLHAG